MSSNYFLGALPSARQHLEHLEAQKNPGKQTAAFFYLMFFRPNQLVIPQCQEYKDVMHLEWKLSVFISGWTVPEQNVFFFLWMTGLQKARTHDQCLRISSIVGFGWDSKSDKGSKYMENYKVLEFTSKWSGKKMMVASKMRTSVRRKLEGINKACDILGISRSYGRHR